MCEITSLKMVEINGDLSNSGNEGIYLAIKLSGDDQLFNISTDFQVSDNIPHLLENRLLL